MLCFYTCFKIQSTASTQGFFLTLKLVLSATASIGAFYAKAMLHCFEGMHHHVRNVSLFSLVPQSTATLQLFSKSARTGGARGVIIRMA